MSGSPAAELVLVGQLVDVLEAAQPGELDDVGRVVGRQPVLPGEPPQQRLVPVAQIAPGRLVSGPDPVNEIF
jgi:hypothetical protein